MKFLLKIKKIVVINTVLVWLSPRQWPRLGLRKEKNVKRYLVMTFFIAMLIDNIFSFYQSTFLSLNVFMGWTASVHSKDT